MTQPVARPRFARRDLFARTAICGALLGFALTSPALALPSLGGTPLVSNGGGAPIISSRPNEVDVTLNAPRTVIDWDTYNVAAGETVSYAFSARNWIVLNRVNDPTNATTINGIVEGRVNGAYGGNIWFASKNGIIVGNGAQIDAGGILLSAAAPDIPTFLDPNNTTFAFPGTEIINTPPVGLASGANVTGHGGLVALIAPQVITQNGSSIAGQNGSNVLYGSATGYTLRLTQNAPGDFDLVDFIVPAASAAPVMMDIRGATSANSVFVAGVSTGAASVVINLGGDITATAATADGGDIVLSGGGGLVAKLPGPMASTPTDIYLTHTTASRDIIVQTNGQVIGQVYPNDQPVLAPPPPLTPPVASPPPPPDVNGNGNGNGNGFGNGNGCPGNGNGFGNGNGAGFGNGNGFGNGGQQLAAIFTGFGRSGSGRAGAGLHSHGLGRRANTDGPETLTVVRTDATDDSQVSVLSAGRDIILTGSQMIALGTATAGRDLTTDSAGLQANALTVGRTGALKSESGDISAGALTLSGAGVITSAGSVQIDNASLSGGAAATLNVTAAGNIGFGDGSGSASGGIITLRAAGNINVDLASANIDSVSAGGTANVQASTLTVNKISGAQVVAGGDTVTVNQATSSGDIYVGATGNATLVSGVAGDDIYVLSNTGAATLTNATLTGAGADTIGLGFVGNPDAAGNGRVVSVTSNTGNASLGLGVGTVTGATAVNVIAGQDVAVQLPAALPGNLTVTAGRDATLMAPTVAFNAVSAGRDVTLMTTQGDFTSTNPLVATRNLTIGAAGNLKVGAITANQGSITLTGTSVNATGALMAGQDLTLKASNGAVQTAALTTTSGSISLTGTSISTGGTLTSGKDLSLTATNSTLQVGALSAAGSINLTGTSVNATGALNAGKDLSLTATSSALQVGALTANAGSITLTGTSVNATGTLTSGKDLTLKATNGAIQVASFKVAEDLNIQGSSLSLGQQLAPIGRDLSITTPGDFTAAGDLAAGRNVNVSVGGMATLKGLTAPSAIDIIANDITLSGTLSAANVQIESATGALQVGGTTAPTSGMWLDNAEFGRIRASGQLNLYAGLANGTVRGDLTLQQLDVDPTAVPTVNFLVGGGHNATVLGAVAPTTATGGAFNIGAQGNASWQPTQILVSGGIGASTFANGAYTNTRAFDHVRLFATQDIIMGSQRFIGLIQATPLTGIQIGKNQPNGVGAQGAEQNVVLVAAGDLELSAQREVVTQNTAPSPDQSVGLFINGKTTTNLFIDPPQLVDVYGAFVSQAGQVVSSFSAGSGVSVAIIDSSGNPTTAPAGSVYRFNSCSVDTNNCSAASTVTNNLQQNMPVLANSSTAPAPGGDALGSNISGPAGGDAGEGGGGSGGGSDSGSGGGGASGGKGGGGQKAQTQRAVPPPLLAAGPSEPDAVLSDPVTTGAGSEEIWRQRVAPPPSSPSGAGKPEAKP